MTTRRASRRFTGSRRASTRMVSENRSTDLLPADLVVVLQRLGDQVDGPGDGEGDEDHSAQVHAHEVRSASTPWGGCPRCVAETTRVTGVMTSQREAVEHAPGALLDGDREEPVVAPVAVDVQEARGVADLADAELLHDPQRGGVLRADRDLDPVQPDRRRSSGRSTIATAGRHDAAAGVPLVDPVADRGELRRAADDVVDRHLADERAVDLDRERHRVALRGPARRSRRTIARKRRRRGRGAPGGTVASHGRSQARVAAADLAPRRARRRRSSGRSDHGPLRRSRPAGHAVARRSVVAPDDLLDGVHEQGSEHGEAVLHPAPRAGQVDHQARPDDARRARATERRSGTPLADAVRPDRLGDAGHLAVEQRRGSPRGSGRSG